MTWKRRIGKGKMNDRTAEASALKSVDDAVKHFNQGFFSAGGEFGIQLDAHDISAIGQE